MRRIKNVALVAHDNRKTDLIEWVRWNYNELMNHHLICTGTTGVLIERTINEMLLVDSNFSRSQKQVTKLKSGPLGGDQQLGALIAESKIDFMIFFWDPMEPQPHDVDVKALLRIAVVYNIPMACNRSTADFMISSPLLNEPYETIIKNYSEYINRIIDL
ncbi:methylglyoxal synthase [candidate division KSB1 bacterium]|nr:methylglyoxal synthase [candidate division KSB1 bacterium]